MIKIVGYSYDERRWGVYTTGPDSADLVLPPLDYPNCGLVTAHEIGHIHHRHHRIGFDNLFSSTILSCEIDAWKFAVSRHPPATLEEVEWIRSALMSYVTGYFTGRWGRMRVNRFCNTLRRALPDTENQGLDKPSQTV